MVLLPAAVLARRVDQASPLPADRRLGFARLRNQDAVLGEAPVLARPTPDTQQRAPGLSLVVVEERVVGLLGLRAARPCAGRGRGRSGCATTRSARPTTACSTRTKRRSDRWPTAWRETEGQQWCPIRGWRCQGELPGSRARRGRGSRSRSDPPAADKNT